MAGRLRLVLVTPETTLLDEPVRSLNFPLFDGLIGILPGRAPMVGRLGNGELTITAEAGNRAYFIDGGFVQIKGEVVSILTNSAIPTSEIDLAEVTEKLEATQKSRPASEEEFLQKDRDLERTRRMLAIAKKPR